MAAPGTDGHYTAFAPKLVGNLGSLIGQLRTEAGQAGCPFASQHTVAYLRVETMLALPGFFPVFRGHPIGESGYLTETWTEESPGTVGGFAMISDPPMKADNTSQGNGENLGTIEERLQKLEATLRDRAIEERLQELEYQAEESSGTDSDGVQGMAPEGEGQKALRMALASFLNSGAASQTIKDFFTAARDLIEKQAERKAKEAEAHSRLAWRANYVGLGFSGLVFIILCVLLVYDKIPKELAFTLIGSLFGYWYGHQKDR
jgi:hypothetical protein